MRLFHRKKLKKSPKRLIEETDLAMIREARRLEVLREKRGRAGRVLSE